MIRDLFGRLRVLGAVLALALPGVSAAATVDLLILYDTYSRNYFGGDPQTAMQNWVNQMNAAYSSSQVDIQLRLVGVRAHEETGADMGAVLGNLRVDTNAIALRDQLGADFVSLLHQTGACGVGYVAVDRNWTWNVVGPQCGPLTMSHELGHNMGLNHSRRQGDTTGTRYRYGLGYGVDNQFGTIMSYEFLFNAPKVARFSNPNLRCGSAQLPCGVPVGNVNEAYAALAIHNVRDEMAAFRSTVVTGGPATMYQNCSYTGWGVSLPAGSYTMSQLQARGIGNDNISSLRVQVGYRATLYQNDNFTGTSIVKTADDDCLVNDNFNDIATSVIIAAAGLDLTRQAESFSSMLGVIVETTTDAGGGQNVGAINTGDWMAYSNITIPTSGSYVVEYRVASLSGGGVLSLDLNGGQTLLGTLSLPNTGGWQNWTTVSHTVNINAGTYSVGIFASAGGWNLNWFRIRKV